MVIAPGRQRPNRALAKERQPGRVMLPHHEIGEGSGKRPAVLKFVRASEIH